MGYPPEVQRLFVTGTDTGVGKTYVASAILRLAVERGKKAFGFKPVETGCEDLGSEDGRLTGPDQEIISIAAGNWQTGLQRGVYCFKGPYAPFVAARAEGVEIDLNRIIEVATSVPDVQLLVVEGAGGWRVPITATEDMSGLARRVGGQVVLVARAGLGTINHTLLTIEAVERDRLPIAAVVFSRRPDEDLEFAESNREEILRRWKGNVILFDRDSRVLRALLV